MALPEPKATAAAASGPITSIWLSPITMMRRKLRTNSIPVFSVAMRVAALYQKLLAALLLSVLAFQVGKHRVARRAWSSGEVGQRACIFAGNEWQQKLLEYVIFWRRLMACVGMSYMSPLEPELNEGDRCECLYEFCSLPARTIFSPD